jgi:GTPase SAR1 family protein
MTQPAVTNNGVLCPVCLDYFDWREDELFEYLDGALRWEKVDLSTINNKVKRDDIRSRCYVRCPNPSSDGTAPHYLPVALKDYGRPIVIGMVGRGSAGKTHLLVAMIHEALRGDLGCYGITFEPADRVHHSAFQLEIEKFLAGSPLDTTDELLEEFADYLLVRTSSNRVRPLIFFDVAGEDFVRVGEGGRGARFMLGATALMFVDDPARAIPHLRTNGSSAGSGVVTENKTFSAALARLRVHAKLADLPVAVVLTKADELRYEYPVDHWLRRRDIGRPLSAGQFRDESRDVYGFLDRYGARPMLSAFETFPRGTLHFVSATGIRKDLNRYPRGVKPARVLQPLLALLLMLGVIDDPAAAEVGS